ncbi:hypothetical protein LTR56_003942 [Elasticomyces elasticus]|nr:hypothetical protein LTR56_003942 [Elasticomyces elasticus]KAK3661071.1 hypothetical protein LTR22_007697 [Elasticomyces elasticus]KAK4921078.1 hypothetical protein LTR49_011448 [Elasticomyces elasticus]KAK5752960.1 hypothetical protein LTS12_016931 [Elasticomyces elasticus]
MSTSTSTASRQNLPQNLLKRHAGSSIEDFRKHYIERHSKAAIPWFLANGVTYYAQIHGPLSWASEAASQKYAGSIKLDEWDASSEVDLANVDEGQDFYSKVILPDERKLFLTEARNHMEIVDAGSVVGDRVEFIVDGKALVEYEEWKKVWNEHEA